MVPKAALRHVIEHESRVVTPVVDAAVSVAVTDELVGRGVDVEVLACPPAPSPPNKLVTSPTSELNRLVDEVDVEAGRCGPPMSSPGGVSAAASSASCRLPPWERL